MINPKFIRNFSIIAHIDHGKSTLADRLIENTKTIAKNKIKEQYLDNLELERKRGITIKLNYIQLEYVAKSGDKYYLNMIDTPGHVDFSYEVSRSLAACEGAILVIDASQGIQAQTLSNFDIVLKNNLDVFCVLNKIDLQHANISKCVNDINNVIGFNDDEIIKISAKNNINISEVLEAIVNNIRPPMDLGDEVTKCIVFDSYYDLYKGALILIKIHSGELNVGDDIYFYYGNVSYKIKNIFIKKEELIPVNKVCVGNVAIISCAFKELSKIHIGDTITLNKYKNSIKPLPGYKPALQVVFSSFFPMNSNEYQNLEAAIKKIKITDDSFTFEPEVSTALGFGIRCGFLGGLHLEVIKERLEMEYGVYAIAAFPSVKHNVYLNNGNKIIVTNPCNLPDKTLIERIEEPYCELYIVTPMEYYGKIMDYSINKRAIFIKDQQIDATNRIITFHIPLSEVIINYFDTLKSISKGYASMDYHFIDYRKGDLSRLDIKLNNVIIEPLSSIVPNKFAFQRGREICKNIKKLLPKHSFEIPIQACIGNKVIARETQKATRKDVTAKLYGGDVSRKKKLLEKQKAGKKRMKSFGKVNVPQNIFIELSKIKNDN